MQNFSGPSDPARAVPLHAEPLFLAKPVFLAKQLVAFALALELRFTHSRQEKGGRCRLTSFFSLRSDTLRELLAPVVVGCPRGNRALSTRTFT